MMLDVKCPCCGGNLAVDVDVKLAVAATAAGGLVVKVRGNRFDYVLNGQHLCSHDERGPWALDTIKAIREKTGLGLYDAKVVWDNRKVVVEEEAAHS